MGNYVGLTLAPKEYFTLWVVLEMCACIGCGPCFIFSYISWANIRQHEI